MGPVIEFDTIVEMFDRLTNKYIDDPRPLLLYKEGGVYKKLSYTAMKDSVNRFALGLAAMGVREGDRVALLSENRPEWVVADLAMMKIGAVNVSIFPTLSAHQVEFILINSGARFAIASNQFQLGKIQKIWPTATTLEKVIIFSGKGQENDQRIVSYAKVSEIGEEFGKREAQYLVETSKRVRPENLLTIIYTSGTTGSPKGVMLTHRNLVSNMKAAAACIPFTHSDILLSFLPLSHSYERMGGYYTAMSCGATVAYAESIETVRENLLEVRPTMVTTVPRLFERMYNRIMAEVSGASALRQRVFHWAVRIGREFAVARRGNRLTAELKLRHLVADLIVFKKIAARTGGRLKFFVSGGAALSPMLGEFFEAIGILIIEGYGMTESSPVISVNRVDEFKFGTVGKPVPGVEVKIAHDGEILVRGPNVMSGYWRDPDATRDVIDRDGWLHTGDIGEFDQDGFLSITDRKKHLFVSSGGKNIAPQHIEDMFLRSQFIDQCVLVGDGRMFLTALIVPNFGVLKEYARTHQLGFGNPVDLVQSSPILKLFDAELARIQKDLASYERVRRYTLLSEPLTIEGGEITPTLKVRRKVVEEKYKAAIEKMYQGID